MMKTKKSLLTLLVLLGGFSSAAFSVEMSVVVGAGLEHTDNANKSKTNTISEWQSKASADFSLQHSGSELNVELGYRADYTHYDKDSQEDDTTLEGDALLVYEQIANTLTWTLENSRRSVLKDKALDDLQSNREDRSISSIAPRLILKLSPRDSLIFDASYTDIQYDDSDQQDSNRIGAGMLWAHNLSAVDALSARLQYQDVSFEKQQSVNDYEYYLATLGYQAKLSRLSYSVDAGVNQSKRKTDDYEGYYFNGDLDYQYHANTFSLTLVHELTDTSRGDNNEGLGDFNNSSGDIDIFERSNVELSFTNKNLCNTCSIRVFALEELEDYENLSKDSREFRAGINFGYKFTRLLTAGVEVDYSELRFVNGNGDADYDTLRYRLRLNQSLSRELSLDWFVSFEDKTSDNNVQNYDELRGGVSISYRFD